MSETINVPRTLKKQPLAIRVIAGIAKYIFLLIIVAISIGPIIWAALSSFKTYAEINASALSLPKSFNFKNYADAFKYAPIQCNCSRCQRISYIMCSCNVCIYNSKI